MSTEQRKGERERERTVAEEPRPPAAIDLSRLRFLFVRGFSRRGCGFRLKRDEHALSLGFFFSIFHGSTALQWTEARTAQARVHRLIVRFFIFPYPFFFLLLLLVLVFLSFERETRQVQTGNLIIPLPRGRSAGPATANYLYRLYHPPAIARNYTPFSPRDTVPLRSVRLCIRFVNASPSVSFRPGERSLLS